MPDPSFVPSLRNRVLLFALVAAVLVPVVQRATLGVGWTIDMVPPILKCERVGPDSWATMSNALAASRKAPHTTIYERVFFQLHEKFIYPPTALLLIVGLESAPVTNLLKHFGKEWIDLVSWISCALILLTAFLAGRIVLLTAGPGGRWWDRWIISAVVFYLVMTFYAVTYPYGLGQIQVWMNAFCTIILWCWLTGRPRLAGVLAGFITLVKPQFGLLLLWGLLRKRWSFAVSGLLVCVVATVISLAYFGLASHLDYLRVLSFLSGRGEAHYANQSINGLLNRLMRTGDSLGWHMHDYPQPNAIVHIGTVGSAALLILSALYFPGRSERRGSTSDLAIIMITCMLASPLVWEHHYGVLIPLFAFLLPALLRTPAIGVVSLPLLGLAYILTDHYPGMANPLASTSWNFLQSYMLAGALIVLALLYAVNRRERTEIAP